MKFILILLIIFIFSISCNATEWFGRNDGGSTVQCLGTFNAPYPGSGTNQNCAYSGLQDLFDVVTLGDIITLKVGDIWQTSGVSGFYRLKAKSGGTGTDADYIIIRTSAFASLPSGRVGRSHASLMPKIKALGPGGAIITTEDNTKYWKFIGIEITNISNGTEAQNAFTLVDLGQSGINPNHFWFDRCYIHPQEDGTTDYTRTSTRGFGVNNVDVFKLTNSFCGDFLGRRPWDDELIDSECIAVAAAGTNFLIDNNYMNAYFNAIFLGGGSTSPTPNIATVTSATTPTTTSATFSQVANLSIGDYISFQQVSPKQNANGKVTNISGNLVTYTALDRYDKNLDQHLAGDAPIVGATVRWGPNTRSPIDNIVITRNKFAQDFDYCMFEYTTANERMPKGGFEIKWADHLTIEGNVFDGFPVWMAINTVNQEGDSPWLTVRNFILRNNWIKQHAISVLNISFGNPNGTQTWHMTQEGTNNLIENNLFTNNSVFPISGGWLPRVLQTGWGGNNLTIRHNTFMNNVSDIVATWAASGPTTNFVFKDNIFWQNQHGISCSYAGQTFADCWPNWIEDNNAVINASGNSEATEQAKFPNSYIVTNTANPVNWVGPLNNSLINNFKLAIGSPYKAGGAKQASDGTDVGANIDNIINALSPEDLGTIITCNWHTSPKCNQ